MNLHFMISAALCVSASLVACTPKASTAPNQETSAAKAAPTTNTNSAPAASGAIVDGETYQVLLPQRAGEPLKVQPKVGYKVNKDFPHRVVLKGAADVEVKGEHTEALLSFSLASAGDCPEKQCKGTADFSICNDQMCKLYRGVDLSWSAP